MKKRLENLLPRVLKILASNTIKLVSYFFCIFRIFYVNGLYVEDLVLAFYGIIMLASMEISNTIKERKNEK